LLFARVLQFEIAHGSFLPSQPMQTQGITAAADKDALRLDVPRNIFLPTQDSSEIELAFALGLQSAEAINSGLIGFS
jgi:hypothetical protein